MPLDKLWKLRRRRKHVDESYQKDIRAAKNFEDRQSLESQARFELDMIDVEICVELTRRLKVRARNLDIPVPSEIESWVQSPTGTCYLRDDIRYDLEQRIRKERKEKRDFSLGFWKDILLMLTAIAAIVSSIWSIFKK